MRVIFMGSGAFGLPTLSALVETHDVVMVVSQPDRPAGRNREATPTPVSEAAMAQGLTLIRPVDVNQPEIIAQVRDAAPDAIVVIAFGQKIGPELIALPAYGASATMNLHASLLPKYRGAAPIHRAILGGENETGNTVFALVEQMDAGPVLGLQHCVIGSSQTTGELHDQLAVMGPELILAVLKQFEDRSIAPQPQDPAQATLAPKLSREQAVMDWQQSADHVRRQINGLTPWPGLHVWIEGDASYRPLLLRRAEVAEVVGSGTPGELLGEGLVATGAGAVRLLEVQPAGKRTMSWAEFSRGRPIAPGTHLLPQPREVSSSD